MTRYTHMALTTRVAALLLSIAIAACSGGAGTATDTPSDDAPIGNVDGGVDVMTASQPADLRAVAYTFQEIELFWRNPEGSTATHWEIARDGVVLTAVPGPSFYESGLAELATFTYTVTPLDDADRRGPSASVTVTTPTDAPVITPDSALDLARAAMAQPALMPLAALLDDLRTSYYTLFPAVTHSGTRDCPDGGSVTATRQDVQTGVSGGGVSLAFDHCSINDRHWHGAISLSQQSYRQPESSEEQGTCSSTFSALSLQRGSELPVEVDGTLTSVGVRAPARSFSGRLVERHEAGSVILDAAISMSGNGESGWQTISGGYTLQSQQTLNRPLSVSFGNDTRFDLPSLDFTIGQVTVTDPHGGQLVIDPVYVDGQITWTLATRSEVGESTVTLPRSADTVLGLPRWTVGSDCALLYPPDGLELVTDDTPPSLDDDHPFAEANLPRTLDTLFALQQSRWLDDSFDTMYRLARLATEAGGSVTAVPSPEATLLEEAYGTATYTDPDTGEEKTVTYVQFEVEETRVDCPLGGTVTDAVSYRGATVIHRVLAEQCVIGENTYDGEWDSDWAKYSGHESLTRFTRSGPDGQLDIADASRSNTSAFAALDNWTDSMAYSHPNEPTVSVSNHHGAYAYDLAPTDGVPANYLHDRPVSRIDTTIALDDGVQGFRLVNDGDLHRLPGLDVSLQGRLVATATDGATLTVIPGNGDNASFDLRVSDALGHGQTRRWPWSEAWWIRVR